MITKFKIFEELNIGRPKLGDYVICGHMELYSTKPALVNFIENNIGILIKEVRTDSLKGFRVQYFNVPSNIINNFGPGPSKIRYFSTDDIIYWSENKEELEEILATKKYNL